MTTMNVHTKNRPKVAVAVIIKDNKGRILLLQRKGGHGDGAWCLPGGHLEYLESIYGCAKREVKEETNLDIDIEGTICFTNNLYNKEEKHYVVIFVKAKPLNTNQLKLMEPDKHSDVGWFYLDCFPKPLFGSLENIQKGNYHPETNGFIF